MAVITLEMVITILGTDFHCNFCKRHPPSIWTVMWQNQRAVSISTQNGSDNNLWGLVGLCLAAAVGNHGDQLAVQWKVPCCQFSSFMVLTGDCSQCTESATQHIEVHWTLFSEQCSVHFKFSAGLQFELSDKKVLWGKREREQEWCLWQEELLRHSAARTPHCTLHSALLHTAHCTLHTAHCTSQWWGLSMKMEETVAS